jgi:hypothetical protein
MGRGNGGVPASSADFVGTASGGLDNKPATTLVSFAFQDLFFTEVEQASMVGVVGSGARAAKITLISTPSCPNASSLITMPTDHNKRRTAENPSVPGQKTATRSKKSRCKVPRYTLPPAENGHCGLDQRRC